ncbi:MAG: TetR family transcriptional regulator C-terminal domain-containing protein [Ruminococcus sp.]|jgi:AcrR family transcriptional regulator|nr:TetR family transcriptional regulator C-terminal domain-containing protein [Ruminococcus sp.]
MEQKKDRRIRKTRAQLQNGLAKLMKTKSINEITVKELVDEVDINRSTFYLHYTDIYNLLEDIENRLMDEILRVIDSHKNVTDGGLLSIFTDIFTIIDANRDICSALIGEKGDMAFVQRMEDIIASHGVHDLMNQFMLPERPIHYMISFSMSGCIGMLKEWLSTENSEPPEYMANVAYNTVFHAFKAFYNGYAVCLC